MHTLPTYTMKYSIRRHQASLLPFILLLFVSTILPGILLGQQVPKRYVAITFDDLPVVCQCETDADRMAMTEKLIAILKKHKMPILGVVNEQ